MGEWVIDRVCKSLKRITCILGEVHGFAPFAARARIVDVEALVASYNRFGVGLLGPVEEKFLNGQSIKLFGESSPFVRK